MTPIPEAQPAPQPGVPEDLYSVVEQRTSVRFRNTTLYNSRIEGEGYNSETYNFNGQMDYVTGTHNLSVGTNVMLAVPVTDFNIDGGLEYPHYTRPAEFRGWPVPEILLSGDHGRIDAWRRERVRSAT